MRLIRHLLPLALAALGGVAAAATPLAERLPPLVEATHASGAAVATLRDGRTGEVAVAGLRAPGEPLRRDTVFNVASLTKPVFALLVLRMVAAGEFALDAPLATWWVDPDVADDPRHRELTARLVLSHQSGLPNWRGDRKLAFLFDPGQRHEYSGEGFEWLRLAIERKTGETLPALMARHVTGPAGMRDSHFGWDAAFVPRLAIGFDESGEAYGTDHLEGRGPKAASSLFTTVDDYARFVAWVIDGAGLPVALWKEMTRSQAVHAEPAERFGLGWRLLEVDGDTILSHDGREIGVRTQVFVDPARREGLVVLGNGNHGELLVEPLATAGLSRGAALMDAVARDTWRFVQSVPREQLDGMLGFIARSPSFVAKFLQAANAGLLPGAGVDAVARGRADRRARDFALAMVRGERNADQARGLMARVIDLAATPPRVRTQLDAPAARDWLQALAAD